MNCYNYPIKNKRPWAAIALYQQSLEIQEKIGNVQGKAMTFYPDKTKE
jgi:hypothetical protein